MPAAVAAALSASVCASEVSEEMRFTDYVNPFIGTTNFGTTNPGAVRPNGMMSVTPFNVMGSDSNRYDKDARWWSTPYDITNSFFTGFSHVNLSGVGCPEMGSLLLTATTGPLEVDYHEYGSAYHGEKATPGYYGVTLDKSGIRAEATVTRRVGVSRFTFPTDGEGNILLNLGEGLTNESGASVRRVNEREFEGSKLLGTFCYVPQAVFPIYFVMRVDKTPAASGFWKKQRPMTGVEAEWDKDNGRYKIYTDYGRVMSGDDIGVWMRYDTSAGEQVQVCIGVSFVSVENARENLEKELGDGDFDRVRADAEQEWNDLLGRIEVEGGSRDQKEVFYTALYHALIHPNVLNDVNGDYPIMESDSIGNIYREVPPEEGGGRKVHDRYTVFSLWDTYRNLHQLLTLVYPERQEAMVNSMLDIYREHGWLPKWELYGRETLTMEGDPSIPVIVDTWSKGLRNFDIDLAYEAMMKGATTPGSENLMRPDNDDYMKLGYVPLREEFDNSVSHALEYYIADYALAALADSLGRKDDARMLRERSKGYRNYYCKDYGTLRPKLPDGSFLTPFDPKQGENFEPSPGFHEGNAWNYTFYVPHDIKGLVKLMGGERKFTERLQSVFDRGNYDPANEPDIAYPYLFSQIKGEEWRTQKLVKELLEKYFTTSPDGIPGNDDAGTMSAWAIFSMMGFYPDIPGVPVYTVTTPTFDKVTIHLNQDYYPAETLTVEVENPESGGMFIDRIESGGKKQGYRISHKDLIDGGLKIKVSGGK
ncbi:MAG: GH92 family glycosyl hydrolase [Muribaculaceae bacterium]|nr:GH92 family glycosyl hydrolase [Muribaculaceae bacterium]